MIPGIGAEEVPAEAQLTRPFVSEITILQRERSPDIPQSLWLIGCLVVLVCTLAMIAGITWGGGRINNSEPQRQRRGAAAVGTGMTRRPERRLILADHPIWLAVPAFAPAIVVAGVVVYIAVKNRARKDDATQRRDGAEQR